MATTSNQLAMGMEVEKEHLGTYDYLEKYVEKYGRLPSKKEFVSLIAKDHLKEFKNYYSALADMEDKLKNGTD